MRFCSQRLAWIGRDADAGGEASRIGRVQRIRVAEPIERAGELHRFVSEHSGDLAEGDLLAGGLGASRVEVKRVGAVRIQGSARGHLETVAEFTCQVDAAGLGHGEGRRP